MAIVSTGDSAATAMENAENAARTAFMADKQGRALTESEIGSLKHAMRTAAMNALFAHMAANIVVNVTSVAGVTTGGGVSGPGTGTVT